MLFLLHATLEPFGAGLFLRLDIVEQALNRLISHFRKQAVPSAPLKS